mgnify:CR=1 FL=1
MFVAGTIVPGLVTGSATGSLSGPIAGPGGCANQSPKPGTLATLEARADTQTWDREPASVAAVDSLLVHLEEVLTRVEFLDRSNPGQVMTRLRRLFTRIRPDDTEIKMLRGALTEIERALVEAVRGRPQFSPEVRRRILERLTAAETLE